MVAVKADFDSNRNQACPWWIGADKRLSVEQEKQLAGSVGSSLKAARDRLRRRRDADLFHTRLVLGNDIHGLAELNRSLLFAGGSTGRSRFNISAATIGTAASLIAHAKPQPLYLTVDGDFGAMRKARKATQAIQGLFNNLHVHDLTPRCFVDASMASLGVVHGYLDANGRPAIARVNPFEIVIDPVDAYNGLPRTIYRIRPYSREVLGAQFPEWKHEIAAANGTAIDDQREFGLDMKDSTNAMVMVWEAWHLPSAEGEGDGRYTMSCDGALLRNEEWEYDWHPFCFYRFEERLTGFFGLGIAEQAVDSQVRINELIQQNTALQTLGSNTWVFVRGDQDVKVSKMTNAPVQIVRHSGPEPKIVNNQATAQDLQIEIDRIQAQLLFRLGLSESRSSGERAPGVYSGVGLRATDDIQSQRLAQHVRRWETFHMQIAEMLERLCDLASDLDSDFAVDTTERRASGKYVKALVWKDVRSAKGERRTVQVFPISSLPSTPTGKLSFISEWIDRGFVSQPFALSLLDFPDTDQGARMQLAHLDYCMWMIEEIIEGEDVELIPHVDQVLLADVLTRSYLRLRMDHAPENVLERIDELLEEMAAADEAAKEQAKNTLATQPGAAPAAPAMPGMDPALAGAAQAGLPPGPVPGVAM